MFCFKYLAAEEEFSVHMAAILKMVAILEFCVASAFFEKSGPQRVFVPNFKLASQTEVFLQLSAAL